MAAAAGKRGPKPIAYFHDEFATLGSNETPKYAEEKFLGALYGKHREENYLMNSLILPCIEQGAHDVNRTIATSVHSQLLFDFREFQPDQERALYIYREFFYREFLIHPHVTDRRNLSDISYEAKRVLAYYAPYLTLLGEFPSGMTRDTAKFLREVVGSNDAVVADYEQLASGEEYEYMGIHQRRMMEEIERAALMVPRERDVSIEHAIRCFITQFPLEFPTIIREFSKTELNQFLIPAVAKRTEILHILRAPLFEDDE